MADWSALPQELLCLISLFLTTSIDIIRFRSVCTAWRAVVQPLFCAVSGMIVPIPAPVRPILGEYLYLAKRTVYNLQSSFDNNNNNPSWIIKFGQDTISHAIHLYHPIRFTLFETLPETFPKPFSFLNLRVRELGDEYIASSNFQQYMGKVAVLKELDNIFVMLLANGHGIVYLMSKSGNEEWTVMEVLNQMDMEEFVDFDDVIVMGRKFYVVDNQGRLATVNHIDLSVEIIVDSLIYFPGRKFLVVCQGNVILVDLEHYVHHVEGVSSYCSRDYFGFDSYREIIEQCFVFKLDENSGKWKRLDDLGDMILFLGGTNSFSASAKDVFGETSTTTCCKGNCIIYWSYVYDCCRVFDLETHSFKDLDSLPEFSKIFWPPPHWAYSAANN